AKSSASKNQAGSMRTEDAGVAVACSDAGAVEVFEERDEVLSRHIDDLLEVSGRKLLANHELCPQNRRDLIEGRARDVNFLRERDDAIFGLEQLEERAELGFGANEPGEVSGGG